jgi:hypothetical protein
MLTGQVPDISPLLSTSSEPVYYKDSNQVSSESTEALGYWVGMAPNVGHAMTYKILTDTRKIIVRSCIRILLRSKQRTYVSITTGKGYSVRLISKRQATEKGSSFAFDASDLDGPSSPCQMMRETRESHSDRFIGTTGRGPFRPARPQLIRWKLKVGEDVYDEVMSYNRMLDFVNNDSLPTVCMRLTKSSDIKDRREVERVKWTGYNETTMEPLTQFKQDDFVTCAIYAEKRIGYGWLEAFKKVAKRPRHFTG